MDPKAPVPLNALPGFQGLDAPQDEGLYRCVHCGLCLSSCPTYVELGVETESPRGRIALMKAVHEGRLGISQRVASHWEMCLGCRACEAVCPSGVPYGRLIENTPRSGNAAGPGLLATENSQGPVPEGPPAQAFPTSLSVYTSPGLSALGGPGGGQEIPRS